MDPRHRGATPSSGSRSRSGSGGSGGRPVDTSTSRRRRMSIESIHNRDLMQEFNTVGGGGYGGSSASLSSSSSGGLDLGQDEFHHPRYNRRRVYPEVSPMHNLGRRLLFDSQMGSPTTQDEVFVLDGVLVANGSIPGSRRSTSFTDLGLLHASSPDSGDRGRGRYVSNRQVIDSCGSFTDLGFVPPGSPGSGGRGRVRCSSNRQAIDSLDSFTDLGFVPAGSPGSGGRGRVRYGSNSQAIDSQGSFTDLGFIPAGSPSSGGSDRYGSNHQFAYGREYSRVVRAMYPRSSEVEPQSWRSVQGAGSNMQGGPRTYPLLPPSLPGPAFPTPAAAPRGAAISSIRTPSPPYFTPPRAPAATISNRPQAPPYLTPPRAAATPARAPGSSSASNQPEVRPPLAAQQATFEWPTTEEEEATISQHLYGPGRRRRLPVFESICPR